MSELSTKEKILAAARQLFVEHGFAGTSMGNIAKLAGVNHSLIFHHFGNKKGLWREVKMDIAQHDDQKSKVLPDTNLPFDTFLKTLLRRGVEFYRSSPDIVRMINWQRLESGSKNPIGIGVSRESDAWIRAFAHYQQTGDINPDLDPRFMMMFVLSVISSMALDHSEFISEKTKLTAYIDFCAERFKKAFA